jgi:hypothetical protein
MVLCAGGCVRAGDGARTGGREQTRIKKWWLDRFEHLWQYNPDVDGRETVATPTFSHVPCSGSFDRVSNQCLKKKKNRIETLTILHLII